MNRAHGLRANHAIFTAPLTVDVALEEREEDAKAGYPGGTWLVHSGEFPKGVDVGMVSDGHGFEDSPDCERIAGGVNSKGPMAVAIGRQANMLQWGFYGAPDRMTVPAKRAFLNAIVWMKQFDGERPLAPKIGRGRSWLAQYIDGVAKLSAAELADTKENSIGTYYRGQFPPELVKDGIDVAKLRQWYADNEEYFGPGKDDWHCAVDADLAALKLSNRKPECLDWLLAAFAKDAHDAVALRLATRYLGERKGPEGVRRGVAPPAPAPVDAAGALSFIEANREFLFFSDTAGFRWLVDENRKRAKAGESDRR